MKIKYKYIVTVAVTAMSVLASSCVTGFGGDMERSKACAQKKGEEFVLNKYPDFDRTNKTPTLVDMGEKWKFYYELPPLTLGSTPVVIIDKQTCEIVRSYRTQ